MTTKTTQRVAAERQTTAQDRRRAAEFNEQGLKHFEAWELTQAVSDLASAARLAPNHPDYHLNHARALARSGDYDCALQALAEFIRVEPDADLVERYERLFATGLDDVEQVLTHQMTAAGLSIEEIGAAMQMWLEYRITIGRQPLVIRKPETWAAALDFTVRRVNLHIVPAREVAALYQVSEQTVRERHHALVHTLDIMPCDYRYFTGHDNPLDKLVEAAELLQQLEDNFQRP